MTDDIAELVKGLSKAQRAVILGHRSLHDGAGKWPLRHALSLKGIITPLSTTLTPLGERLRSHLQQQRGDVA